MRSAPHPRPDDLPRMRSITEVAGMSARAARGSWIACGLLQPVKVGHAVFIPQSEVDGLLVKPQPTDIEEVPFELPGYAVEGLDALKERQGLRNRSQVLLQLIEKKGHPPG